MLRFGARKGGSSAVSLLLLFLLLPASSAMPTSAAFPSGEGWGLYTTENFRFYTNLDQASTRRIGANLEQLRATLVQQFPDADFTPPVPALAYVFADRASFEPFALGGGSGFFVPHVHANFVAIVASDAEEATPIVYRQYVNAVVANQVPQAPLWLRQGLAELLSTFTVSGRSAVIGATVRDRDMALEGGAGLGLEQLLAMRQPPAGAEQAQAFADRSWSLVHYLVVESEERRRKLADWIDRLEEDESVGGAFLAAYGSSAAALEAELDAYLARDPLPERRIELQGDVAAGGQLLPLPPEDALVALTDLLLHTQPTETAPARELIDAASAIAPRSPGVLAVQGLLADQAGDKRLARDRYAEAIAGFTPSELADDRDGFRLYFYYGDAELELLGRQRPQDDAGQARLEGAVDAFRKAVEIRPTYGEGWARLGYALNLSESPPPDAVPALEKAYELLPEREDIAMNLLLAYARIGEQPKADELVRNLEHRGEAPETVARAKEVLFQIDYNAAVKLIRAREIDEAAKLLERIETQSGDPTMQQRAKELLGRIGR